MYIYRYIVCMPTSATTPSSFIINQTLLKSRAFSQPLTIANDLHANALRTLYILLIIEGLQGDDDLIAAVQSGATNIGQHHIYVEGRMNQLRLQQVGRERERERSGKGLSKGSEPINLSTYSLVIDTFRFHGLHVFNIACPILEPILILVVH